MRARLQVEAMSNEHVDFELRQSPSASTETLLSGDLRPEMVCSTIWVCLSVPLERIKAWRGTNVCVCVYLFKVFWELKDYNLIQTKFFFFLVSF